MLTADLHSGQSFVIPRKPTSAQTAQLRALTSHAKRAGSTIQGSCSVWEGLSSSSLPEGLTVSRRCFPQQVNGGCPEARSHLGHGLLQHKRRAAYSSRDSPGPPHSRQDTAFPLAQGHLPVLDPLLHRFKSLLCSEWQAKSSTAVKRPRICQCLFC